MSELWDKTAPALRRLLPPGSRVLVATSGGPDSQTLLDLVGSHAGELELGAVFAAGVDHGLRANAALELEFAATLAAQHGIPFARLQAEVARAGNILANARKGRYQTLYAHADAVGADRIAVAHTATDQAETVLFHLARGAGLVGGGGMRARRGRLVRPLLEVTRGAVLEHLALRTIEFAQDPSNTDLRRARAQLRAHVLPTLTKLNGGAVANIARFARRARRDEQTLVRAATRRAQRLCNPNGALRLEACRGPLGERTLAAWLLARGVRASYNDLDHVLALRREGAIATLGENAIMRSRGHLWRVDGKPYALGLGVPDKITLASLSLALETHIETVVPGRDYSAAWSDKRVAFDADQLHLELSVRSVRPGDRLRPFGHQGSTKVGDLFTDLKIPLSLRPYWPIVTAAQDIAWVVGLRRGRTAPVTADTRQMLIIEVDGVLPFCPC